MTDQAVPSYCSVSVRRQEEGGEVPNFVPLLAGQYMRAYFPNCTASAKPKSEETQQEASSRHACEEILANLQGMKLVDLRVLAEAWPGEYSENNIGDMDAPAEEEQDVSILPSLASLTIGPATMYAVDIGETTDIERMVWLPGKCVEIKAALRKLSPFPETGMMLLANVVGNELEKDRTHLDLSGISLSSVQIETLISRVDQELVDSVNLSHISTATIQNICTILTKFRRLKSLVLIGCPTISSRDINDSLVDMEPHLFTYLEALIHPFLLNVLNDKSDTCSYRDTFSSIGIHNFAFRGCSLLFFTPSSVIRALIDFLQPLREVENQPFRSYSFLRTSLPLHAAFSSHCAPNQCWSERSTVIPQLSFRAIKGEGWTFASIFNMDPYSSSGSYALISPASIVTPGLPKPLHGRFVICRRSSLK